MRDKIEHFKLKDQHGELFNTEDLLGNKKILLSFHPLAFTKLCSKQMKELEERYDEIANLGVYPVGISVDPVPAKHAWAKELGIKKLRILSDFWPHGGIAKMLGIFREQDGFSERANIIVDENGEIIFKKVYEIRELPDLNEILEFLKR
ncbi:MAG TPA: redoxin domain-containing protein [Candidatus Hydrothermia bacterium]|nr:redoxin domain-containing protein [Candidatus Hydrothermae bacterium]MDD3649737.1 redoxin domain-containing protein [Candidatus Hydrothermia bacterium]MDD5572652.1 redoxin domain-containing protein [Candidatus Hydrothermia bacterium]HOK23641.1 redoxin domain-containing protein [Candidatus Hydrothermia bacterium]HOL24378.1 redoxin domain-containing protein [Candidatus Hydrothermia bacterium]